MVIDSLISSAASTTVAHRRRRRYPPRRRSHPRRRRPKAPSGIDAAIHLDVHRERPRTNGRSDQSYLVEHLGHEALSAEAGKTVIHKIRSIDPRKGSTASNGVSGLRASPARSPSWRICAISSSDPPTSHVHRAAIGAGLGKVFEVLPRISHHQMAIKEKRRVAAKRRHDRGPRSRLGTKCPSMTSTWSQSADAATSPTCSANAPKSAANSDGAIRIAPWGPGVGPGRKRSGRKGLIRHGGPAQSKRAQHRIRRKP